MCLHFTNSILLQFILIKYKFIKLKSTYIYSLLYVKSRNRNQEQSNAHQVKHLTQTLKKNEIHITKRKWKSKLPNEDLKTA